MMSPLVLFYCFLLGLTAVYETASQIPISTVNWAESISVSTVKFSARNGHASCVFNGSIWVVGGRGVSYPMYDLVNSVTTADVWSSSDGAAWIQEVQLKGDYYAQNYDAKSPGELAPWYPRFGHSLTAINQSSYSLTQGVMILTGGYTPQPSNDVWVTPDGITWYYTGTAPWSPRGYHSVTTYKGKMWLVGGSPLNNEVWSLDRIVSVERTRTPLTRAMYMNSTYALYWSKHPDAPWSPRVGAGLLSQLILSAKKGDKKHDKEGDKKGDSMERMVLAGGFGGWPFGHMNYTGISCMSDVWQYDGQQWSLLTDAAAFDSRAWFVFSVLHVDQSTIPEKMFLFSGGNVGNSTLSNKKYLSVEGKLDAYWSTDGIVWNQISYEEGGGSSPLPQYSSQEWSNTALKSSAVHLGMWGATMVEFNTTSRNERPGSFFLIGGQYSNSGPMSSAVYESGSGIVCDVNGVACNGQGICGTGYTGCNCTLNSFTGDNCQIPPAVGNSTSSAMKRGGRSGAVWGVFVCVLSVQWVVGRTL